MVLMQKGDVKRYVPDIFVNAFRKDGFLPFGEGGVEDTTVEAASPSISEGPKTFACPHCDKTYAKEATLKRHIAEKHKDD